MLRKKRLKCESISARLFLACHQKSNAFKCKQFCCAKPTLAHLLAGGFAPRPRERRAAVHSLCYSVGSSAHSPANALELDRVRARAACVASRPLASSVSLFHCGAAIGGLFLIIYQVACFTFFVTCNDLQIITSRSNLRRCVESPHPTRTLRNKAVYAKG